MELENSIPRETMLSLVYMAGYIERNNEEGDDEDDTTFYYQKYPEYFDALNRGELKVPTDQIVQWAVFCYVFFTQLLARPCDICLNFLIKQFSIIATTHDFSVSVQKCRMFGNILMKKFAVKMTPNSSKEHLTSKKEVDHTHKHTGTFLTKHLTGTS